ncbi:MAG: 50S ribosomal protein L29 [Chloroflexi bacterium]|nr:50S ribosomal protein L29 [Chloroflexota bacterium]
MKARELRAQTTPELRQQLEKLREQLFRLRFQLTTKQLANPSRLTEVKRDIARLQTILREREWAAEAEES